MKAIINIFRFLEHVGQSQRMGRGLASGITSLPKALHMNLEINLQIAGATGPSFEAN